MKFGIALQPGYGQYMLTSELVDVAQTASDLGYHSLWTTDQMSDRSGTAASTEPLVTIASLMHLVPAMQVGIAVMVLPFRNAVVLAKQAASLSVLSNGRFALGVGVGGSEEEFGRLNVAYSRRGRKTDESIEVMRQLWRDEDVTFDGQFYGLRGLTMRPKPPGDRVPLWIGGRSSAAIRRAARVGDAWVPALMTPQALQEGVVQLRALCAGRRMPTIATMEHVRPSTSHNDDTASRIHVAGSVEDIVSSLQAYEKAGLEHLICSFLPNSLDDLYQQMRVFAENVMPYFCSS